MNKRKKRIGNGKKKGDLSLMLLVLVVLVVLALVLVGEFVGNYFSFVYWFINIKGKLNIFMVNDDKGTELISLLNAKSGNFKHIELLGMYTADGIAEEKSARIEPVKATIENISKGYDFTFQAKDVFVKYSKGVPVEIQDQTKQAILNCPTSFQTIPEDLKKKIMDNGGLKWPSDSKVINSGFGGRDLGNNVCDCHGGLDIAGKEVNVYAAAPGTVIFAGKYGGSGNLIVIGHPSAGVISLGHPEKYDYYTFYGHLSENSITVKAGDAIAVAGNEGKVIGKSGNTGFTVGATSYHLHFELGTANRPSDKTAINPCGFLDQTGVTGLKCEHEQVPACKYVAGMVSGTSVSSYQTDVPLPGPSKSNTNLRGQVIFKQWN